MLDLEAFSIDRALEINEDLLQDGSYDLDHLHDTRIGTFSFKMEEEVTEDGVN